MLKKVLPESTDEIVWISSDTLPTTVVFEVKNNNETIVNTGSLVDSGNGHWYYNYTYPNSEGYYNIKTIATIGGKPYKNSINFRVIELETD